MKKETLLDNYKIVNNPFGCFSVLREVRVTSGFFSKKVTYDWHLLTMDGRPIAWCYPTPFGPSPATFDSISEAKLFIKWLREPHVIGYL